MERRLERRVFCGRVGKTLCPVDPRPSVWLPCRQCGFAKKDEHSLLNWIARIIAVRKTTSVFGAGSIEFLYPANHRILAYVRQLENETILVVNNLSNAAQAVELDLRRYKGNILIEMFGKNIFPRVGDLPYLLTLGPYQFYWFRLRRI